MAVNPYGSLGPSPAVVSRVNKLLNIKPHVAPLHGPGAAPDQFDPVAYAKDQAQAWLQSQLDAINAQKQAYLSQLQESSDMEMRRGQAIADALVKLGIPQQIQTLYGNASSDIGGLAQAFSGELRDVAAADAARETRMVSGTGQEGAVANNGNAMGDVVYGVGGYIPARNMSEQGAAFASQAAMEPGFATRIGGVKAADVYSAGLEGLKQFTDSILQAQGQVPEVEQKILEEFKPEISYRTLANGQIQAFDDRTGHAVGPPQGPTKAKTSGKNTIRTLANGQLQAFNAMGKPVGKPYGPAREAPSSSNKLQARTLADGRIQWFDPETGQPVGAPQGPKRKTTKTDPKTGRQYNLQLKTLADGSQQWFDPRTGRPVGGKISQPKVTTERLDQGGRILNRSDGVTPTQARKYKTLAYTYAKSWHNNGGQLEDDNGVAVKVTPFELLKTLVNDNGIPYDLAVRQMARWTPAAREWLKNAVNPLTGQSTKETRTTTSVTLPQVPKADILPTSWTPTHVSDGLGWGTKSARDLFPGPAGTPVGSPISGTVLYFHPDGAQGGGSMEIRGDDGYLYWIGHIDAGVPQGTRVDRGSQIAVVSSRHPNPHVHIDRRYMGANI